MALLLLLVLTTLCSVSYEAEDRTWIFSVSGNRRPYNFIDEEGKLKGFDLDLARNVCAIADKKCAITVQPFTECIQTVKNRFFPGRGIMSGWFDACLGYTITQDRVNTLKFTLPYLKTYAKLAVKPGNTRGVDLKTLSNRTITHLNGAYTNKQCLTRLKLGVGNVVVSADLPEAKELVLNGTVDAIFSPRTRIPDLQTLDVTLHCDLGGVATMVTKGSSLPDWWNPAFKQFVTSGQYSTLCDEWMKKTKYKIKCFNNIGEIGETNTGSSANISALVSLLWTVVTLWSSGR